MLIFVSNLGSFWDKKQILSVRTVFPQILGEENTEKNIDASFFVVFTPHFFSPEESALNVSVII